MKNELIKKYENKELTEGGVNEIFSSLEQIGQRQHQLLASFLQAASGGVALLKSAQVLEAPTTNPPGTAANTTPPAANDNVNILLYKDLI